MYVQSPPPLRMHMQAKQSLARHTAGGESDIEAEPINKIPPTAERAIDDAYKNTRQLLNTRGAYRMILLGFGTDITMRVKALPNLMIRANRL